MMKYGHIKKSLESKGFVLEYMQTGGELDLLTFNHPKIDGYIDVEFTDGNKIPKEIVDGKEFTYDDTWVEKMNVLSVSFNIDRSISYLTEGVIDTYGCTNENVIILYKKDLKYFDYVLNILTNPYTIFDFQVDYNKKFIEFINDLKRFIPAIEKHNLPCTVYKTAGNINTLYGNMVVWFKLGEHYGVYFYFDIITWEKSIDIHCSPGFLEESGSLEFDCKLEDFEKELDRQMEEHNTFMENYKDLVFQSRGGEIKTVESICDIQ